jgi:hypothetical protein
MRALEIRWVAVAVFLFAGVLTRYSEGGVSLSVVAYTGEAAPGIANQQLTINPDYYPALSDNGQIGFAASEGSSLGIWTGSGGSYTPVAYPGLVGSGNGGQAYDSVINGPDVEQLGPMAFDARLTTNSGLLFGTWIQQPNGTAVAVENPDISVPGYPSSKFQTYATAIGVNPSGQYAFWSQLNTDTGDNGGIWINDGTGLELVNHNGLQVPGFAAGVTWTTSVTRPEMGANGQVDFFATLSNGQLGVFTSNGQTTSPIAITGQAVPGNPGYVFGQFQNVQPAPDSDGDLALGDGNIWLKNASGYHLIAQPGTAVIGGGVLSTLSFQPYAANNGQVSFFAHQTDGNTGIFYSAPDGIHVLARTGMQAPGQPAGTTFNNVYAPEVNNNGQVAFIADLKDASGNVTLNYLFATEPNGTLDYVAGAGTTISLPTGTFTATAGASLYSRMFNDVELTQFDDSGDLVFTLQQFSGQPPGVIVEAHVGSVPEPTGLGALIAASGLLLRRRGRRAEYNRTGDVLA